MSDPPFGLNLRTADWMPDETILIIGSCSCRHSIGDHMARGERGERGERGCAYLNCDCETPLNKLVSLIKPTPEVTQ
jgi:hypothetical protein